MDPMKDVAVLEEEKHQEKIDPDPIQEQQKGSDFGVRSRYENDNDRQGKRSERGSAARVAP